MNWRETFRTGWSSVASHRLRSALTMLGIIIGVSSVILTVGLGQGAQDEVRDADRRARQQPARGLARQHHLVLGCARRVRQCLDPDPPDAVSIADRRSRARGGARRTHHRVATSLVAGTTNWTTQLAGTTPSWLEVRSRKLQAGRFFTQDEVDRRAKVVVLGSDTASELFGGRSAVGQTVTADGTSADRDRGPGLLRFLLGRRLLAGRHGRAADQYGQQLAGATTDAVSTIYVEGRSEATLGAAYAEITNLLLNLHDVSSDEPDFTVTSQESLLETANSTNKTLTVLLGGIAAISLLVGGIGVMNIMLVSVTERIREIGLRKALGATPAVIRRQFLVEASLLGLAGGLIGVLVGALGAQVLPSLIKQPVSLSALAAAAAIGTSLVLGIGFGVYPASRAARLTPIDALRSE